MRLLAFGDTHWTKTSEFSSPTEDGTNEYVQSLIKSLAFVGSCVREHNPDVVTFGGDLFDASDYIDTMTLSVAFRAWYELSRAIKLKFAIVGNHDYYDISHRIHTLEFLRALDWIVIDELTTFDVGKSKVGFLPYRSTYTYEDLRRLNSSRSRIIVSHVDVIGGRRREPKGTDPKAYSSIGVPSDSLHDCGVVLNSHFHHPSTLDPNWINIGSLGSRTFHDKGSDPRGVVIVDADSLDVTRIANPHAKSFHDYSFDSEEQLAAALDGDVSNQYARVYYNPEIEESVKSLTSFFAGVRLVPVKEKPQQVAPTDVDLRFSLASNLETYIKKEYDDQELLDLALGFLHEAETSIDTPARSPINFGRLSVSGFQCFKSIELDLDSRGLLLVRGVNNEDTGQDDNGSGKSSLIEAIYWCLTGSSLRGYSGNEVIHWDCKSCRVSLDLLIDKDVYTVVRTRKDPELATGVHLFLNGEDIGARLSGSTEDKLDELIGRSEVNLQHVCFLTGGLSNRFTALSYPARTRLLEDIIDSKPYQKAQELAKDKLGSVSVDLYRTQGSLESCFSAKQSLTRELEEVSDKFLKFDEESKLERDFLLSSCSQASSELSNLSKERDSLNQIDATLRSKLSILRTKRSQSDGTIASLRREITSVSSRLAVVEAELSRISTLLSQELCPTCGSRVGRVTYTNQRDLLLSEKSTLENSARNLQDTLSTESLRINNLEDVISSTLSEQASLSLQTAKNRDEAAEQERIQASSQSKLDTFDARRQSLENNMKYVQSKLDSTLSQIHDLDAKETDLVNLESKLRTLSVEVFDEKGVRNALLSYVAIPYINSKLPEYTTHLWGSGSISLTAVRRLKTKCKNEIEVSLGGDYTYKGCSSGQRRRIDLAIQFALNDLAIATGCSRVGFLAIDEVLDHLDEAGIYAAKEVLLQKASLGTILMVTHSKYAASITTSHVVLTRSNRETQLQESCA